MTMLAFHIEHSPESRLKVNGKDCDELVGLINDFIRKSDLTGLEGLVALVDTIATQAAGMDYEVADGSSTLRFLAEFLGSCYVNAMQMFGNGEALIEDHPGPHGAH